MKTLSAMVVLSLAGLAQAQPTQVFYSNFDSGQPAELTGYGGLESVGGFAGAGNTGDTFTGDLWRNDGTAYVKSTLTLTNLPAHNSVSVGFLLAFIDSWDSTNGSPAPDWFNLDIDGTNFLQLTSANASGNVIYAGDQIYWGGAGWNGSWWDRAFDMGNEALIQSIPHTASTLTLDFYASGDGWQAGLDESFAIDNLEVIVNKVPAPGAVGALSIFGLAALLRRR